MKTEKQLQNEFDALFGGRFITLTGRNRYSELRDKIIKWAISIPMQARVMPESGDFYYLRNKQNNKIYQIDSYAAKFTSLCYPDIEGIYKSITGEDYYLLDECGRCDWINTAEWDIVMISQNDYRRKVLDNEFEK